MSVKRGFQLNVSYKKASLKSISWMPTFSAKLPQFNKNLTKKYIESLFEIKTLPVKFYIVIFSCDINEEKNGQET